MDPRLTPASSELIREVGDSLSKLQRGPAPPRLAVPRTQTALRVILIGIAGFAALTALVRRNRLEAMDLAVSMRLQAIRHPFLERAMSFVSWFGFPPQSRLLPPLVVTTLWLARFRLEAAFQLAAWGSALLSSAIKHFMQRPRPAAGTDLRVVAAKLGGSSFPSGHVLTYVGTYGWLSVSANILIVQPRPRRAVLAGLLTLLAGVGPSRIYLGHHWPSDVAASYLLGTSYVAVLVIAYRRLKSRRVLQ
jgi:undecaprenyl-diphosphatase